MKRIYFSLLVLILFQVSPLVAKNYRKVPFHSTIVRSDEKPLANENVTFFSEKPRHLVTAFTDDDGKVKLQLIPGANYTIYYKDYSYKRLPVIPTHGMNTGKFNIIIDEFLFASVSVTVTDFDTGKGKTDLLVTCLDTASGVHYEATTGTNGKAFFYLPRDRDYKFSAGPDHDIGVYHIKEAKGYSSYSFNIPFRYYSYPTAEEIAAEDARRAREWFVLDSVARATVHETQVYLNTDIDGLYVTDYNVYTTEKKDSLIGTVNHLWTSERIQTEPDVHLCDGSLRLGSDDFVLYFTLDLLPGTYPVYVESTDGSVKATSKLTLCPDFFGPTDNKTGKAKILIYKEE